MYEHIYQELAKKYSIEIIGPGSKGIKWFPWGARYAKNWGVITSFGGDWYVFLGEFDCDELKLVGFFHEIGHAKINDDMCGKREYDLTVGPNCERYENERQAWKIARELALEYDIEWTNKMTAFEEECLAVYGNDRRYGLACLNWK